MKSKESEVMWYLYTAENDSQPQPTNDKNASFVRQIYLKTLFQNESLNNHVYSEDMFKSTTIIWPPNSGREYFILVLNSVPAL